MTGPDLIAWVSLLAAVVGIILLIRRIIIWNKMRAAAVNAPVVSSTVELSPDHTILVISNGAQMGPFTRTEVLAFNHAGRFAADAVYWEPGMADWLPVKTLG